MQSYIIRCKHCQKEYSTSEDGASMEYCPECQRAIDNALSNIPVKFKEKQMEILEPMLFPLFDRIRKENEEKQKNGQIQWPAVTGFGEPFDGYDNMDVFIHNRKKYSVKYNDETPEDRHIYISMVYDILNETITNQPWRYDTGNEYVHYRNLMQDMTKRLKELYVNQIPMKPPRGDLFSMYDLSEWTLHNTAIQDTPIDRTQKGHTLKTRFREGTGAQIKSHIKYGWYKTRVNVTNGIDIEKLIDFVDYKYTYQQYEDENVATIISIEAI